jgi:hypothetical protein
MGIMIRHVSDAEVVISCWACFPNSQQSTPSVRMSAQGVPSLILCFICTARCTGVMRLTALRQWKPWRVSQQTTSCCRHHSSTESLLPVLRSSAAPHCRWDVGVVQQLTGSVITHNPFVHGHMCHLLLQTDCWCRCHTLISKQILLMCKICNPHIMSLA